MNRRKFLKSAAAAGLLAALANSKLKAQSEVARPDYLSYLAMRSEPVFAADGNTTLLPSAHLTEEDRFWLVAEAYLYMTTVLEGTHPNISGMSPYNVLVGGGEFTDYDDHPRKDVWIPRIGDSSDAAGIIQLMSFTFDDLRAKYNQPGDWIDGPAFSPANQEQAWFYLVAETGSLSALLEGTRVDTNNHLTVSFSSFNKAIQRDASTWASFPYSPYGQSNTPIHEAWSIFTWHLWAKAGYYRPITHPFGDRAADFPLTSALKRRWGTWHKGEDYGAPTGTPLHATENGTIKQVTSDPRSGNLVSFTPEGFPEMEILYMHCSQINVQPGQQVQRGDVIALSGNTGEFNTGPHLHIEVWVGDSFIIPSTYLELSRW